MVLNVFLIVAQNFIKKINVVPFTMPYIFQHNCNEFPLSNLAKVITTLTFTRMFSLKTFITISFKTWT